MYGKQEELSTDPLHDGMHNGAKVLAIRKVPVLMGQAKQRPVVGRPSPSIPPVIEAQQQYCPIRGVTSCRVFGLSATMNRPPVPGPSVPL